MRAHITTLSILVGALLHAQGSLIQILNNDTNICTGNQLTLQAQLNANNNINPVTVWGPPTSDDQMSALVPIGFNFVFFGNTYNTCAIATNGYIQFGMGGNGYSPWAVNAAIPNSINPVNAIMAPWGDIYPGLGGQGQVRYKTIGTAPNRIFIVEWLDSPVYSSSCAQFCYGTQIKLFETTNVIETHIANYQACTAWNGGYAIHGIQNITGTVAYAVPGRNYPSIWSATNDGYRWTPTGATTYSGSAIPFNPTFMPANITPAQISWTANGANIGTGLTQTVSPNVTTQYIAKFNYSTVCSNSFSFADTVNVTVGQLSVQSSGNQSICPGGTAQIFVQPTNPMPNITYSWNPPTGLSATHIPNPTASPSQTTQYSVLVSSPTCSTTQSITVTVHPPAQVTASASPPAICPGASSTLNAQGAAQYQWTPATGLSNASIANPSASPPATTTYIVTGTDANGCVDSDTITLSVYPPTNISVSPTSAGICQNDSVTLTASGASQYYWILPGAGMPNPITGSSITVSPTTTETYYVAGVDANQCVDTIPVTVTVYPSPVASFTPPGGACVPASFTFSDNSTISSGSIAGWFWNIDGHGYFATKDVTVTYQNPGTYGAYLMVVSDQGCTDTVAIPAAAFAYPNPVADFSYEPDNPTIADPTVQLVDESQGEIIAWEWTFEGVGTASHQNPAITFPGSGDFIVSLLVTSTNGCTDVANDVITVDAVNEIWIPSAFTPNGDGINETFFPVGTNLTEDVYLEVLVFDRWGDLVYSGFDPNKPWDGSCGTLTECPVGAYSYKVTYINEKGTFREFVGRVSLIR